MVGFVLTLGLLLTFHPAAAQDASGKLTVHQVSGSVYVIEDNFYYKENSAFYVGDKSVTVIGATWTPEIAKLLFEEIKKITDKPVTDVILTNYHPDRAGGSGFFKTIGAALHSTQMTFDCLKSDWNLVVESMQHGLPDYPSLPLVLPDSVHAGNFDLQNGKVSAIYYGPSHTSDGIVVYFPSEKILYGGCILKEHLGNLDFAELAEYPKTLKRMKGLDVKIIIAGHWSAVHGPELIDRYLTLLENRPGRTTLQVENVGSGDNRRRTKWLEAIRSRRDDNTMEMIARSGMVLTQDEENWANLVNVRVSQWSTWADSLAVPFGNIQLPPRVTILLGNQGGADAFTFGDSTICFDLQELQRNYGSALASDNRDRLDRFFCHEYTHVLHKAWRKTHPIELSSPFQEALWDCLVEGMGNYRSLSSKWKDDRGVLTAHAIAILNDLQPVFVDRLNALRKATPEQARKLTVGLSTGPFDQKWGALPVALWLAQECKGDEKNLRKWVEAGPQGVLVLAKKYLPKELKERL